MNPFLIGATILCWTLFLFAYFMSAVVTEKNAYIYDAFLFFIVGIVLLIACGASWNRLHDTNPAQPPAIEQHK
jgi:uncharacterized membrane protein